MVAKVQLAATQNSQVATGGVDHCAHCHGLQTAADCYHICSDRFPLAYCSSITAFCNRDTSSLRHLTNRDNNPPRFALGPKILKVTRGELEVCTWGIPVDYK